MDDLTTAGASQVGPRQPANPVNTYLSRLSLVGRVGMARELLTIARLVHPGIKSPHELPWQLLRYQNAQELRARLIAEHAPATVNHQLSALRGVLKECWRLGLMSTDDYYRTVDLQNVRGHTVPTGRDVPTGELLALARVCQADPSPIGVRDGALLAVAFTAGLRLSELVGLEVADYRPETGELLVRHGKGEKQRRTYVAGGAQRALDEWLALRGSEPGPVFVPVNKGGTIGSGPLVRSSLYERFVRRAAQAGIAPMSPHDGRRTWIGDLLEAGVDIAVAQRLAGHASPATTAAYDRRPELVKRQAVEKLWFPWR